MSSSPAPLSEADVNSIIERHLAEATPQPSFQSQVYGLVIPSVVTVVAQDRQDSAEPRSSAIGAGVVVDEAGIVLTSHHVVRDPGDITVVFADGSRSAAFVLEVQPDKDLAILLASIVPDDLQAATLASASGLSVGDEVVAIGAPFGLSGSLTAGVVSGLGRTFEEPATGTTLTGLIQFDAAVNPGNSGGPLVDRNGDVVGIVTGLANPTGQSVFVGVGYAVPIEAAGGAGGEPWY